jgi:hypothetical protein
VAVWTTPCDERDAERQVADMQRERRAWLDQLSIGASSPEHDPWPVGRIVRMYDESGATLDFRSGQSTAHFPTPAETKRMLLAGLALPPEMEV